MATPTPETPEPTGDPSAAATARSALASDGCRGPLLRAGPAADAPARAGGTGAGAAAERFARAPDRAIAVRGGGHPGAGTGTQTSAPAKRRGA